VKVYTVPGQVHYELTRRQVLAGADAVVLVVDSTPSAAESNVWALDNLRLNLKANNLDPDGLPQILQWNKRDLPEARPVSELASELNPGGLPSHEAVATEGTGVVETFATAVKAAIRWAYHKAGKNLADPELVDRIVDQALASPASRAPEAPESNVVAFEHRFDSERYKEQWAEKGRNRNILDAETLLSEAVQTGMELAEKLDGVGRVEEVGHRRAAMLLALDRLSRMAVDPKGAAVPDDLVPGLLQACGRSRASVLLFRASGDTMDERQVFPPGPDPLNAAVSPSIGSAAYRLCQGEKPRHVEDLKTEVFFNAPPAGSSGLASCFICPLCCDGLRFGALVAYGGTNEPPFDPAEQAFWSGAATLFGLSLHWRGLRRKLA
jgi:hypothetical protein